MMNSFLLIIDNLNPNKIELAAHQSSTDGINPELISYIGAGFIIFILFVIYRVRKNLQQDNMSQRSKRFGK